MLLEVSSITPSSRKPFQGRVRAGVPIFEAYGKMRPMDTAQEIEGELERFYRDYIDLFNRELVESFLEYFARPYMAISGEHGLTVIANDAGHVNDFRRIMSGLKRRGWVRSDIVCIKAWALDPNLGMILADVTRRKADNSVLEDIRACYMVRRDGQSWKITTITEVKPPFLGPGDIPRQV